MEDVQRLQAYILGLLPSQLKQTLLADLINYGESSLDAGEIDLEDSDKLKSLIEKASESLGNEISQNEMSALFYSVCMVALKHSDEEVVTLLLQQVLPGLLNYWKGQVITGPHSFEEDPSLNWPKSLWERLILGLTQDGDFGPEETKRCLMVISRCLSLYFPYSRETGIEYDRLKKINFDLRREDGIAFLLLDGLESDSSMARKESVRILKSIVAFSTAMADDPSKIIPEEFVDEDCSTRIFVWRPDQKQAWIEVWTNFFLLYESLQQPQGHIIQPMLPLLKGFLYRKALDQPWLGLSWWETLINRAFNNDAVSVRKMVLESVLRLPEDSFPALRSSLSFVFGSLLELCDVSSFYLPLDTTTYVSKFGELVVDFYARFLNTIPKEHRSLAINEFIEELTVRVKAPNPAVYLLTALVNVTEVNAINEESLEALQKYASSTSTFHNKASRKLAKWLMLRAMIRLADPSQVSYRSASAAIEFFVAEQEQFQIESQEYKDLADWLERTYGKDLCEQSLKNEVERYFTTMNETSIEECEARARRISIMMVLAMSSPGAFVRCCKPAYDFMASIRNNVESPQFVVVALLLFIRLDEAVRRVSSDKTDLVASLQLAERIFEWIDTINNVLISSNNYECLEYRSVMILLEGQKVLLKAATCLGPNENDSLIGIVEMQLYILLDHMSQFSSNRESFTTESFGVQLLKIAVLEMMEAYFRTLISIKFYGVKFFEKKHTLQVFDCEVERPSADRMTPVQYEAWSDLQVSFVVAKWRLLGTIAEYFSESGQPEVLDMKETFEKCLIALETAKYQAIPAILGCLNQLTPLIPDLSPELLEESMKVGQVMIESHYDAPKWFDVYAASYLDYAFQSSLLLRSSDEGLHGKDGLVRAALHNAITEICPKRKGLINKLSIKLYETWSQPEGKACRDMYVEEIASLLVFGPVRDMAEEKHISLDPEEQLATSSSSDYLTRVYMITLLNNLDSNDASDCAFAISLIRCLIDRSLGIGVEEWELKKVFPNAIQHRRRMRLWQALLVLQRMLTSQADFEEIEPNLWKCIEEECMASTRSYVEWFLIRCYCTFLLPSSTDKILARLANFNRSASFSISTMIVIGSVALHSDRLPPPFYREVMDNLVAWQLENNHQVRATASWTLAKLWKYCLADPLLLQEVIQKAPSSLRITAERLLAHDSPLSKTLTKLDSNPSLNGYDPIDDYNLEWVFYEYPKVHGMATDELITFYSFQAVLPPNHVPKPDSLPIRGSRKPTSTVPVDEHPASGELDRSAQKEDSEGLFKDYQRKQAVWDLSLLEEELGTFRRNRELEKRKALLGETIIVASLVDKIPNLAGLSRTCEIFGATRLTVPSASILSDPQFKAISMTSDKWLQIDPVPPASILDFLEARRREGFRILAVEQTSASVPLHTYTFPERFVLLLGNETSGIPPELLHVVDDCVEIPQNGMIRSLNVHVCGSIVLWEARRQTLVKNPALMRQLNTGTPAAVASGATGPSPAISFN